MSRYVRGCGLTWAEYLQAESFVDDIRWEISDSGAKVLGSLDSIARDNGARIERHTTALREEGAATRQELREGFSGLSEDIRAVDSTLEGGFQQLSDDLGTIDESLAGIDDTLRVGFVTLHFDLGKVRESLVEMGATFEWGFNELAMRLGHIGDTLGELLRVAKTPEQTWAYEQFAIACDANRKGLYNDAIDYAQRAITGYQSHTGYRLDHRAHHLLGLIYLGDRKSASSGPANPETAEKHLLDAARYAEADYAADAARALTAASHAAYVQKNAMDRAEAHATRAVTICRDIPEAHFQLATVKMSVGKVDSGLHHLRDAIDMDRLYVVKAWSDTEFMRHEAALAAFTNRLRDEKAALIGTKASDLAEVSTKIVTEAREVLVTLPDLVGAGRAASLSAVQTIEEQIAVFQEAVTVVANPPGLLDVFAMGDALEAERGRLKENISRAISAILNSLINQPLVVEKLARSYRPLERILPNLPDIKTSSKIGWLFPVVIAILFTLAIAMLVDVRDTSSVIFLFFVLFVLLLPIVSIFRDIRLNMAHVAAIDRDLADEKTFNAERLADEYAFNAEKRALSAQLAQLDSVLQSLVNSICEHAKRADVSV